MDVNVCPQCAGPMKWRAIAQESAARAALVTVSDDASGQREDGQRGCAFPLLRRWFACKVISG